MIIGHGDIASMLRDKEGITYFASGVSNSGEERESEYQREVSLLMEQAKGTHLVYFSSLSVFYSNNRYAAHKRYMEELVRKHFNPYTIIRLGNITWGNNPHTLINFIKNKLLSGEPYEIKDVYRYIINEDEFLHWVSLIPPWSCEMNITGRMMKVKDIFREYCWTIYKDMESNPLWNKFRS